MEQFQAICGDCLDVLRTIESESVDAVVTDPPYGLSFMGKKWDYDVPSQEVWSECLRVLKPGGHLLSFSGSRTYHRMTCAIEDAGFDIRDQIMWIYGSGFPKSLDVSKAIDKAAGVSFSAKPASGVGFMNSEGRGGYNVTLNRLERSGESTEAAKAWSGWGTALKPAHEPICVARKPLSGTVTANVLAHGVGALNIDAARIPTTETLSFGSRQIGDGNKYNPISEDRMTPGEQHAGGRWPANVILDEDAGAGNEWARFFYCPKASKGDRGDGNNHPTVKPIDLMRYLVRLVTPQNGIVLDPFMGSGTTGVACAGEGLRFIGIEKEPEYLDIARRRIAQAYKQLCSEVA